MLEAGSLEQLGRLRCGYGKEYDTCINDTFTISFDQTPTPLSSLERANAPTCPDVEIRSEVPCHGAHSRHTDQPIDSSEGRFGRSRSDARLPPREQALCL